MKKHDLQPTDDNIRSTFYNDSIGRNKDLVNFIKIIDSIDENYSIALDSYWGSGKTFFVKQVKMILDTITDNSYCKVEGETAVLSKWVQISNNMQIKKHVPIYYDAWANDCDDDPIYSLVYQMILDTENNKGIKDKISFSDVLSVAGKITEAIAGFDPNDIADAFKKGDFLETLRARKDIDKRIEEYIDKLLPEGCDRLLIIIDELDRCNPEFAVKLLERIKHYFNNNKVTFLFSVNLSELQHTIKTHYGEQFNAIRYLDRFFDLRITLPPLKINTYFKFLSQNVPDNVTINALKAVYKFFNLHMRECSRLVSVMKINNDNSYEQGCIYNVIDEVLLPFTWGLMITDVDKFRAFISGRDGSELVKFIKDDNTKNYVKDRLIYLYDDFEQSCIQQSKTQESSDEEFEKKINLLYSCLYSNSISEKIGMCRVDITAREYFQKAVSLLEDNIMLEEN